MASSFRMRFLFAFSAIVVTTARPTGKEYKAKKAAEAAAAADASAKDAKMVAVNKVVSMLEDVQRQVLKEGEQEAKTYNTFACWAKTAQKEKQEAIKAGKDDKASLSADIAKLSATRKDLDTKISELQKDLADADKAMKAATRTSDSALAEYEKNKADLTSALSALTSAIKELKAAKSPSLIQLQDISKTIRQAVIMADALGLSTGGSALLQDTDVPVNMENYKFHSGSIIETLEKLLGEFRTEKNNVDAAEVERKKTFHMLMQEKTDLVKSKTTELEDRQNARSKAIEDIARSSQELSTVSATLLDDLQYLSEVNDISSRKAKTWDQRSKVRADELSALTAAIGIVKGTVADKTQSSTVRFAQLGVSVRMADVVATNAEAMEAIEASAEEAEGDSNMGFLQRRVKRHSQAPPAKVVEGRRKIVDLLRSKGQQLKSTLLSSLASEVASQDNADVFAKVKVLIQELIERLLTEAANEATHKGWCSKAIQDATQKRENAASAIASLNADLGEQEALKDKLEETLAALTQEIKELKTGMADAEKIRKEEKAENKNTTSEAQEGLAAVQEAIKILTRFYATAAKSKVDASFVQLLHRGPKDDMPDAGFEGGEAYTGASAEAGGVVGMLEVIESDFVRTVKETAKAEEQAEADHLAFMTESGKSLAEKETAHKQNKKYRDDAEAKLEKDGESLKSKSSILETSIKELLELQPACVDTGMSYQDRVAHREGEISALKKASCILNAYASYGPDGLADSC